MRPTASEQARALFQIGEQREPWRQGRVERRKADHAARERFSGRHGHDLDRAVDELGAAFENSEKRRKIADQADVFAVRPRIERAHLRAIGEANGGPRELQ